MERTRTEIGLFAAGVVGLWLFGAGVIVTNKWLCAFALLVMLFCLCCLALRNSE